MSFSAVTVTHSNTRRTRLHQHPRHHSTNKVQKKLPPNQNILLPGKETRNITKTQQGSYYRPAKKYMKNKILNRDGTPLATPHATLNLESNGVHNTPQTENINSTYISHAKE
jgi:hypothetical protein